MASQSNPLDAISFESTSQVIKDMSDRPMKVVGAMVDITQRKQAADALRESESRMRTLHRLSTRLFATGDLNKALDDLLGSAIEACGAHFGAVQLFNLQRQGLEMVAHRGFRQPFLDRFRIMHVKDGTPMARFLERGEQRMVEDLELDPDFAPLRHMTAQAGLRSLLAAPVKTHDEGTLGILITLFRHPHRASAQELQLLELYAGYAADLVVRLRCEQALRDAEQRKDQFIATLAHELRGPLAPLSSTCSCRSITAPAARPADWASACRW